MDDNMNNRENENENVESSFGSSEYYKKLYNDFPEDVAEMLIGTHPLMKKEVSEELTHSIKIKSAREKNRRAVSESLENEEETAENSAAVNDAEPVSASKDPVERNEEPEEEAGIDDYVGDITNFTKGLVTPSSKRQRAESAPAKEEKDDAPKSEDDITAEKVARMLGGVDVEPVDEDEYDDFEEPEYEEKPKKKVKKEEKQPRKKKQRRNIEEKDLELSNIDKQASLNELFREDDDYYEEKHSGNSVVRIVIVVAAIVVLAFFIYKVASLSGQVSKLNEQVQQKVLTLQKLQQIIQQQEALLLQHHQTAVQEHILFRQEILTGESQQRCMATVHTMKRFSALTDLLKKTQSERV